MNPSCDMPQHHADVRANGRAERGAVALPTRRLLAAAGFAFGPAAALALVAPSCVEEEWECKQGYVWEDPEDPDNHNCVKAPGGEGGGAGCDATNCTGCCSPSGCLAGDVDQACGSQGVACTACAAGSSCQVGQCGPTCTPACDPAKCETCQNGACAPACQEPQICSAEGTCVPRWSVAEKTVTDALTGLVWMRAPFSDPIRHVDAEMKCMTLTLDGHGDWRLPKIQELRTLIAGCPGTEPDGACQVSDPECLDTDCSSASCEDGCAENNGPAAGGCYWEPGTWQGPCDDYYSVSEPEAQSGHVAWWVLFPRGAVRYYGPFGDIKRYVRCVRDP